MVHVMGYKFTTKYVYYIVSIYHAFILRTIVTVTVIKTVIIISAQCVNFFAAKFI